MLRVELGRRSYPIIIERGSLAALGARMADLGVGRRCLLVTNPTVGSIYGETAEGSLLESGFAVKTVLVEDSETAKCLPVADRLYGEALEFGLDRSCPVVALGGGVVGDLAGFVAATYMRGVPFVQVPTTLLAQVDSSVGGKVAVNYGDVKNLVGSFYQPQMVVIDPLTLDSLPAREFKAGMAEMIKYGIIRDAGFFSYLEQNLDGVLSLDPDYLETAIQRSCEIKAEVVSLDEREKGLRAILNLGHTIGHAVEVVGGFTAFRHGEALAIGTCAVADIAHRLGLLDVGEMERIIGIIAYCGLPVEMPQRVDPVVLLEIMKKDKKNRDENIALVLPRRIGAVEKYFFSPEQLLPLL